MKVKLARAGLWLADCKTRLPFRFGVTTMTWAPLATVEVEVLDDQGGRHRGWSSDLLVPKWFDKDPAKDFGRNIGDLLDSFAVARETMIALKGLRTPFDLWWRTYGGGGSGDDPSRSLVRGFGVALLERAVIDAACRGAGVSFAQALLGGVLGFEPGAVRNELSSWDFRRSLAAPPLQRITVRHTIGMADPLRSADVAPGTRADDGLPEALEEDVRRYGLHCFKVKLCGALEEDLDRLRQLADVLAETVDRPYALTVDANEQFQETADLVRLFEALAASAQGEALLNALLYVEQPLPRALSFDPDRTAALKRLEAWCACIIDEADGDVLAFPRALERGYRGISVKSCKGVFRSLVNRGLCEVAGGDDGRLFQSGEDLTNLPVVALQQDLATMALLGLSHVERNGHHYFRGLSHLPELEQREALVRHCDLYEERDGLIQLRIRDGSLELGSIQGPGFGFSVTPQMELRTPRASWSYGAH